MIVEHWTEGYDPQGYWERDPSTNYTHFVVELDGAVKLVAPLRRGTRHALGIAPWAIGVEHVALGEEDLAERPWQIEAGMRLTCWLRKRYEIRHRNVIGHGEVESHPRFGLTPAGWAWAEQTGQTFHQDFPAELMAWYRATLDC